MNRVTSVTNLDRLLPRRHFLAATLSGGIAAGFPASLIAAPIESDDCLAPSSADSLVLYITLLFKIQDAIIRPYLKSSQEKTENVKSRYDLLLEKVLELEKEVPGLSADGRVSIFKEIANRDISKKLSRKDASQAVWLSANTDHNVLLTLATKNLDDSVKRLQADKQGLALSAKALEILRDIIQLIRDLKKPIQRSAETATAGRIAYEDVSGRILKMRNQLLRAVPLLITTEGSSPETERQRKSEAIELIKAVLQQLIELDTYKPPVAQAEQMRPSTSDNPEPTRVLRDLLNGVLTVISQGQNRTMRENRNSPYGITTVSYNPLPASGLYYQIKDVLRVSLPQALWLRAFSCMALIFPILTAYSAPRRKELIYDIIPYIIPGGAFDQDDSKRLEAAQKLSDLSV